MYTASYCRLYLLQVAHDSVVSGITKQKSMPFGQYGGRLLRPDRQCLEACSRLRLTSGPSLIVVYSTGSMYMSFLDRPDLPEVGFMNWCSGLPVLVVDRLEGITPEVTSWLLWT